MRFVSYIGGHAGIEFGKNILNLQKAVQNHKHFSGLPSTVLDIIRSEAAYSSLRTIVESLNSNHELENDLKSTGALEPKAGAKLAAPFEPLTIYAVGMNYTDHLEEMNTPAPSRPYSFVKATTAVIGDGGKIRFPHGHETMVDWEAELAIVIGKPCYQVEETDALSHVFGYMCANDISARDWCGEVFSRATPLETIEQWAFNLLGKQYPTFCPVGPSLITADEVEDPNKLEIQCRINGQVMQKSHTSKMVFSPASLVSYLSQYQILRPGDVILSGTMGGVGFGRTPQIFLKPGDVVEVEIEKIGILRNIAVSAQDSVAETNRS